MENALLPLLVVEVANVTAPLLVVAKPVPMAVIVPAFCEIHVPLYWRQPAVRFRPLENVEVATEVDLMAPAPVRLSPFPPIERPALKVEVETALEVMIPALSTVKSD